MEHQPVVVGTGPAGLFAAWLLAERGFRPIVLERGDRMNLRVQALRALNEEGKLDPESNYLFGEGGAGTFSDGKLTTRSKDPRAAWVLEAFRERTGVETVVWDYRPHLGSDRIRRVVGRLRAEIQKAGGEIRYRTAFEGVEHQGGRVVAARTSQGVIPTEAIVLAPGHSARDLYRQLLADGVPMTPKPFQLGFRVEHPQPFVDRQVYGAAAGHERLGPADYRLAVKVRGGSVFSFCMCPGGEIIPAISDLGHMNTNGMSWANRATGFANSGLVTTLDPEAFPGEGPLAGLELQERFEARAAELVGHGVAVPAQRLRDWEAGRPSESLPAASCRSGLQAADLHEVVPPEVNRRVAEALSGLDRQLRGFRRDDALLVGPECRSSSPVRLDRDAETLESPGLAGLLPCGEGAGFAGGDRLGGRRRATGGRVARPPPRPVARLRPARAERPWPDPARNPASGGRKAVKTMSGLAVCDRPRIE